MSLNLLLFYTLIAYSLLHFTAFAVTPTPCMTPALPMAWQQTLKPFVLVFWWILGLVTMWINEYEMCFTFWWSVLCHVLRMTLFEAAQTKRRLFLNIRIDLEVW